MLGTWLKNTIVGNATNPGKDANGTDYQHISRKFGFSKRVEVDALDDYGYDYFPPGRRSIIGCLPRRRCKRRSSEGFENNNNMYYIIIIF